MKLLPDIYVKNREAKYEKLVNFIKNEIKTEKLLPGQKMYSEHELEEMFHISRQTVRRALEILTEEGILTSRRGSGTYINERPMKQNTNRTGIAIVTTYVDDYIFPRTIQGIESILFGKGYSVQIAFTNNGHRREQMVLEDILKRDDTAGIIMETTKSGLPNPNLHYYEELQKKGIPVIFINSSYPGLHMPHVSLNDRMVGFMATDYLIKKGHKRIGCILKLDDGQGHLRYQGYTEAMHKAGLDVRDSQVMWVDTADRKHLMDRLDSMIRRFEDCTALFCYNDQIAREVEELLKHIGNKIPQDTSLISVDDSELAVLGQPALTSIPHPMEALGKKAAENLLRMITNPEFDGNYEFDAYVVERESVHTIRNL